MENTKILSLKNIIVFILLIGIIALSIYAMDILLMLFASFVISCAINPVINKMEKRIPRIWCVTIILLALILISILILIPLFTISVREAISLINNFPSAIDNIEKFLSFKIFNQPISSFITIDSLKDPLTQGAQQLVENSIVAGKWVANFFTSMFAIAIMVFYFSYDEKRLTDKFIEFFPPEQKDCAKSIFENISSKVGNYVFAQGIAMVFVGALTAIGLMFLHHQHAILLGFITCICDIIPVVGPAIAIGLGLITSIGNGFGYVIATFAVYIVAQWAQNQFLRPVVFGKLLNMHPLLIIVALLVSARFLGFWGVILSPAIASVICVLVDELYLKKINKED